MRGQTKIRGAGKAQQDFDSEVKSASVELDHWRSEVSEAPDN